MLKWITMAATVRPITKVIKRRSVMKITSNWWYTQVKGGGLCSSRTLATFLAYQIMWWLYVSKRQSIIYRIDLQHRNYKTIAYTNYS
jgi:hypothetical protein